MTCILCVIHDPDGGPNYIADLARAARIPLEISRGYEEDLPHPGPGDRVLLMGGKEPPERQPWFEKEQALITFCRKARVPLWGVCFGGEMIALNLGKALERESHEYGWREISIQGTRSHVFEWHDESFGLPKDCHPLARDIELGHVRGFTWDNFVQAVQFHPEQTLARLKDWTDDDPRVMGPASDYLLESQVVCRALFARFIGLQSPAEQTEPLVASNKRRLVQRPHGLDPDLNRKEYLLGRALQRNLQRMTEGVDVEAPTAAQALKGFTAHRKILQGKEFRNLIYQYTSQTVLQGAHHADKMILRARPRRRVGGAVTRASADFGKLIDRMTFHTVDHFDRIADDLKDRLTDTLQEGFDGGEGIPDLRNRIQEALGIDSRRATERARTLTMESFNQAHIVSYTEVGAPGVEFLAGIDERTCEICGDLNGTIFALDDEDMVRPPVHNFCRCTLAPYFGDLPDDTGDVSPDTRDFCADWRDNYFDIPLFSA
jgi:SPP1 gp7 family putative phage head morphogenesis protein